MPVPGAMSILGMGTVKGLKLRSVFTKAWYLACCSSSLCLKPCHASSTLGSPERTSMLITLLSSLNRSAECVRRLLTWKEAMEEKGLRVNAGKTKIMICGMGLDLLQSSGKFPCAVCCTGVDSNASLQWLQVLGAQEMQWAQALDKGP